MMENMTLAYILQFERENRSLRAGSDARCIMMLGQTLSGSDDADVDFVIEGGQVGGRAGAPLDAVRGKRGVPRNVSKQDS